MNLYDSLNLDKSASIFEVKRAYRKLAKKYHPDKHIENKDYYENKFKEIAFAYEILGDKESKNEYDMSLDSDDTPLNLFIKMLSKNKFCNEIINNDLILEMINKIYGNNNEFYFKLKEHFNNFDFIELLNILNIKKGPELNIKYNISLSLDDIYDLKYKKLSIKRLIENKFIEENLIIPLDPYTEELIYEGKGDCKNGKFGDIIIKFSLKNSNFYEILDNHNLLIKTNYFNTLNLPNSYIVKKEDGNKVFSCEDFIIYKYINKGLYNEKINKRGDLYVKNIN